MNKMQANVDANGKKRLLVALKNLEGLLNVELKNVTSE